MVTGAFFSSPWTELGLVFGALIDVPLIVGGFVLMYRYRGRLSHEVLRVKLPPFALCLILSVPLIIFEEQIDCMPAWCGAVLVPPTLPFLLVEILALEGLVIWRNATNVKRITLEYSIFGVLFEIFFGGLVGAPLLIIAIIGPYVMISYAFVSMLPLTVLIEGRRRTGGQRTVVPLPVPTITAKDS